MQVKEFMLLFGVEKLNSKVIVANNKQYRIVITAHDLDLFSLDEWSSKPRLDSFIINGNYRFYAENDNRMCVWVYPSTNLVMEEMEEGIDEVFEKGLCKLSPLLRGMFLEGQLSGVEKRHIQKLATFTIENESVNDVDCLMLSISFMS